MVMVEFAGLDLLVFDDVAVVAGMCLLNGGMNFGFFLGTNFLKGVMNFWRFGLRLLLFPLLITAWVFAVFV